MGSGRKTVGSEGRVNAVVSFIMTPVQPGVGNARSIAVVLAR